MRNSSPKEDSYTAVRHQTIRSSGPLRMGAINRYSLAAAIQLKPEAWYSMRSIRIESLPPGDAPLHIREAWIGLVLPLVDIGTPQPAICTSRSVLPKKTTFWSRLLGKFRRELEEQPAPGYVVNANEAVTALQQVNPGAAAWWNTHAPHMLRADKLFVFSATCCVELPVQG